MRLVLHNRTGETAKTPVRAFVYSNRQVLSKPNHWTLSEYWLPLATFDAYLPNIRSAPLKKWKAFRISLLLQGKKD